MLGEEHTEVASVYEALGNSFKSEGKLQDAMRFYNKSLVIREKVLGNGHRAVA